MQLLTYGNPKTDKSRALGWLTAIMHFAPANLSGYEVCRGRSRGCTADCLNFSGHGGIGVTFDTRGKPVKLNTVQRCRIARTRMFFEERDRFVSQLVKEIRAHIRKAERLSLRPCIRLNGTSDIQWEHESVGPNSETIFDLFPQVQFYDYTKIGSRMVSDDLSRKSLPSNYHLTYSRAETLASKIAAAHVLQSGGNVAAVFRKALPATYWGYKVIDGVSHDLRFLDDSGVIVGLVAKGKAKRSTNGFVIDAHLETAWENSARAIA